MGRGMRATQPAWMTADTQSSPSSRNFPDAGRLFGPDDSNFVRNRGVDTAAREVQRTFDVQRPADSLRGDAREQELRQAMIASAVDRRHVAEKAEGMVSLPGAAGSSMSSSDDGSEESDSETERKARKRSKRSHKKEKKLSLIHI